MSSADKAPLVLVENAVRVFRPGDVEVYALKSVSLAVWSGELLAILGPSGSGKTTLLNLIGGLDQPDSGRVLFRNRDLAKMRPDELTRYRRAFVGFVFQFYNLVPTLTAIENVELAANLVPDPMNPAEALEAVGLAERANHFPSQLSGGEQQRVAIARALAKRPSLLLCDEPTGALDFDTARQVLGIIQRLPRQFGAAVVIVTHNQAIARMCDRIVRLRSGEIVEEQLNPRPVPAEELVW